MTNFISTITPTLSIGQTPIETSSVEEFSGFVSLILKAAQRRRVIIAVVYSDRAGIGKSTAIVAAAEHSVPPSPTGRPNVVLLELEPNIAPMAFLELILDVLDEKPRGRTKSHLRHSVIDAIKRHDIRLIMFDEADQFSRSTFEELRYIAGKTFCPMILVGLKRILSVIKPYEALDSRAYLSHHFKTLEEAEVLHTVFPGLVAPLWNFDPTNEKHLALGHHIWERTKPSLRLACAVIKSASDIAALQQARRIAKKHVEEAMHHMRLPKRIATPPPDMPPGPHEARSEARHQANDDDEEEDG